VLLLVLQITFGSSMAANHYSSKFENVYYSSCNGAYSVEVVDANGCKGISNAVNVAGVGIET
jgi:hypothetical protein